MGKTDRPERLTALRTPPTTRSTPPRTMPYRLCHTILHMPGPSLKPSRYLDESPP